jgi:ribosomal protein S18 acetylase RimI-like enzyme
LHEIDLEFQRQVGFGTEGRPYFQNADYDDIENVYLNAGGAFWVIESPAREVAAFGGGLRVDEHTARLRRFRVRETWRRRGLGTRLLLEAERFCAERGYRRITLGTEESNAPAQALYRGHGYVEVGERWLRDDLREIEFAKELP